MKKLKRRGLPRVTPMATVSNGTYWGGSTVLPVFVVFSGMVAPTDSSAFPISDNSALVKAILASFACFVDSILALTLLVGTT